MEENKTIQNNNHGKPRNFKERLDRLKAENERLKNENDALRAGKEMADANLEDAVSELKARLTEKDRYIRKVEEECDARVSNKNFVINGLNNNIANLNVRIQGLESQLKKQTPWWKRIFAKKNVSE